MEKPGIHSLFGMRPIIALGDAGLLPKIEHKKPESERLLSKPIKSEPLVAPFVPTGEKPVVQMKQEKPQEEAM